MTSFSSRSELALNLSDDREALTFMGYVAPVNTLDASNANTLGVVDPTNPVGETVYRAVVEVDSHGKPSITDTNAYSGNKGRAAIKSGGLYYAVGNDNNGSGTPTTLARADGAQNPFGLFFADARTLYVADEGDGTTADAASSPNAGLQKWVPNSTGTCQRVYVLRSTCVHFGQVGQIRMPTRQSPTTFKVLRTAGHGELLRGVSFAPQSHGQEREMHGSPTDE